MTQNRVSKFLARRLQKFRRAFPEDLQKLQENSPYSRLLVKIRDREHYNLYTEHLQYLRRFETKLRQLGQPDYVRLNGSTYQMNLYGKYDNFRESCLSAEGLSSRLRFSLQIINKYLPYATDVYLTEHDTRYHRFLAAHYNFNITASVFNPGHLLHQDMTRLTFANESFDLCISLEDIEHIPDYQKAITELCRVTRKKGLCC